MAIPDAATGVLLGLACGDALGRPVEFRSAESIADQYETVTEMLGHGTHGQPAGTITDDTDLAVCIARSLVEQEAFDGEDIADRFHEWYESGPFDVGLMTAESASTRAERPGETRDAKSGNTAPKARTPATAA